VCGSGAAEEKSMTKAEAAEAASSHWGVGTKKRKGGDWTQAEWEEWERQQRKSTKKESQGGTKKKQQKQKQKKKQKKYQEHDPGKGKKVDRYGGMEWGY